MAERPLCPLTFTYHGCPHLRKMKGGESGGKPVYEILHGVTFTGLGLLDRKGADENARILQVASAQENNQEEVKEGELTMTTKGNEDKEHKAAEEKNEETPSEKPLSDDPAKRIAALEKENKALKAQVSELQKRIEELEAEQQAEANKSRADKLMRRLEKQGVDFGGDEERNKEFQRLAGMSDEAFAASEAAYDRMSKQGKADAGSEEKPETKKEAAKAEGDPPLRSDAGVRPRDVDDSNLSLEDQLRDGFMAAYENRLVG